MPKTTLCPSGQGEWATFSIALPASANNNPNVRIGFRWVNNDDGTGADPSFAVDNITLSTVTTGTPPVASFTANQTTICEGDCISFTNTSTGAPFTAINWNFPGATPATSTQNNPINICYATAGTYTVELTVTNTDGTDTETVTNFITVQTCTTNPPVASFTASQTTICEGDCINFTNTSTGAPFTSVNWTFNGASTGTSTQNNPTNICYATAGTYTVSLTVTNADGTDTRTITNYITVQNCSGAPPNASFTANQTTICSGNCVTFQNQSTGTNPTYQWTFQGGNPSTSTQINPTVCYNTPGAYNVTLIVTDANDVDDTTAFSYITVNACAPPTASFVTNGALCQNSCVEFEYTGNGATSFEWSVPGAIPGTSTLQNPTFCFLSGGSYNVQLIVTNSFGTDTLNQTITVFSAPTVNAGLDELINIGETVTLTATGSPGTYSWTPAAYVSCTNCPITSATPPDTTDFIVYVTDQNGCIGSDTVRVIVIFEQVIGVPSAFSPNGNGFNDILLVRGGNIANLQFRIFNRWGELVFESFDQARGWDGTYKGKPENPGVFIYTVDYTFVDGKSGNLKGSVTLIR
jgi:gliding motility-associated-like protein